MSPKEVKLENQKSAKFAISMNHKTKDATPCASGYAILKEENKKKLFAIFLVNTVHRNRIQKLNYCIIKL
jgi:hypothetical protein